MKDATEEQSLMRDGGNSIPLPGRSQRPRPTHPSPLSAFPAARTRQSISVARVFANDCKLRLGRVSQEHRTFSDAILHDLKRSLYQRHRKHS